MSRVILGIDLGTTNTVVAATRDGKTQVIADADGRTTQPSVVSFHPGGEVLTGYAAKQRRAIDPRNTLFSIKRLIGRGVHARETREMQERMPFEIASGDGQTPILRTRAGDFAPAEISALVLDHAKKLAETALGHEVSEAVIAVPASFTEAQRSATSAAGSIAGLTVLQVINEPTAAAVAFGYQKNLNEIVAVYDFGGGTFDISILRVKRDTFEVLSSAGDSFLGGDDIDERIVARMVSECLRQHQVDLRSDATALQRLHGVAEQLKIDLGRRTRSLVKVDEIAYGAGGVALDLEMALTRGELEDICGDLIRQTFPVCDEALHQAGLSAEMISALVLVGGSTRMPLVQEMASKYFQRQPRTDVHPDEAVAFGAALHGEALRRQGGAVAGRTTQAGMGRIGASGAVAGPVTLTGESTLDRGKTRSSEQSRAREETHTREELRTREKARTAEDAVTGGAVNDGTTQDTINEGTITGETITEGTITEGAITEGTFAEGAITEGAITEGTFAEGAITEGAITEGTITEGAITEGAITEGTITEDTITEGTITEDTFAASTITEDTVTGETITEDTVTGETITEDTVTGETITEDTVTREQPRAEPMARRTTTRSVPPPMPRADSSAGTLAKIQTQVRAVPVRGGAIVEKPGARAHSEQGERAEGARSAAVGPIIFEVTPQALGIATVAGFCEHIIKRNSPIPGQAVRVFATSRDDQRMVRLRVCQGNARKFSDNTELGDLVFDKLAPGPRGKTRIEVTFHLDASSRLQVTARDPDTGSEQSATLNVIGTHSSGQQSAASERLRAMRK